LRVELEIAREGGGGDVSESSSVGILIFISFYDRKKFGDAPSLMFFYGEIFCPL
jgi:hypothetical protein